MATMGDSGNRTLLGFDFGLKRIGVAIGHEQTGIASPLTTVFNKQVEPDWDAIKKLIEEWKPDALVLGLPVHMDGAEHEMTARTREFGEKLASFTQLPVFEVDERLSSHEAEEEFRATTGKRINEKNKHKIDEIAAKIILQDWLNRRTDS